jgi:hypothetical protein
MALAVTWRESVSDFSVPEPDGQISSRFGDRLVQPPLQKYSDFPNTQISFITRPVLSHRGRLEIVTDAGQDAVDAAVPLTNGA